MKEKLKKLMCFSHDYSAISPLRLSYRKDIPDIMYECKTCGKRKIIRVEDFKYTKLNQEKYHNFKSFTRKFSRQFSLLSEYVRWVQNQRFGI